MQSLSHIDPVWVIILISPLLFTPSASQETGEDEVAEGETGKRRRQVFREDVSPLLGGKIPSSAFHWSRLMFNNLDSRGISIPDGSIPSSDRLQEGRSDEKRLTLFSDDELNPTIPSTYIIRNPVSFKLFPNPDEKPEWLDHDYDEGDYNYSDDNHEDLQGDIYEDSKNHNLNHDAYEDDCPSADKCHFYDHDKEKVMMGRPSPDYSDESEKPLLNNNDHEAEEVQAEPFSPNGNFPHIKDSKEVKSSHLRHKQTFSPVLFNNQFSASPRRVEVHVFAPLSNANTMHDYLYYQHHQAFKPLNQILFQMKKSNSPRPVSYIISNSHHHHHQTFDNQGKISKPKNTRSIFQNQYIPSRRTPLVSMKNVLKGLLHLENF